MESKFEGNKFVVDFQDAELWEAAELMQTNIQEAVMRTVARLDFDGDLILRLPPGIWGMIWDGRFDGDSRTTPHTRLIMKEKECPSVRMQEGATLLGIVQGDGRINYVTPKVTVDQTFISTASQGRTPEKRFRFVNTCAESGCKRWTGSRCSVIDRVLGHTKHMDLETAALPSCSIRSSCRWFDQNGSEACEVCPIVITDTRLALSLDQQ